MGHESVGFAHSFFPKMASPAQGTQNDNLASLLDSWKQICVEGFLDDLHAYANSISDVQKEALLARKNLADRTREFKRQEPETQLEGIRALLKSYQSLSLIHISEPTRPVCSSRMPSSA